MAKILLVDDDPSVLLTYRAILELKGFTVTAVSTPEEACAALQREGFSVLLCDLSLRASRNGFELINEASAVQPGIAPVLLTGLGTDEIVARAAAGKITLLFKPVEPLTLLNTIASLVDRKARRVTS